MTSMIVSFEMQKKTKKNMLIILQLQIILFYIIHITQHGHRVTFIKQTMFEWGRQVGKPLVFLSLVG